LEIWLLGFWEDMGFCIEVLDFFGKVLRVLRVLRFCGFESG
jgi:hypothetical protein